MEFIDWLRANVAVAQFFAYIMLTITTAIVAILSLRFSYRQHHGRKPILLLVNHGLKSEKITKDEEFNDIEDDMPSTFAWMSFDLWNRRTYPIVIENVHVCLSQDIFDRRNDGRTRKDDVWILRKDGYELSQRFVLDNGKHHSFNFHGAIKADQSLDAIDCEAAIKIQYFDPRRKKSQRIVLREPYNFRSAKRSFKEKLLGYLVPF